MNRKLKRKIFIVWDLLRARFFNIRIPYAIRWQVTERCVSRCQYCTLWKSGASELPTQKVLDILKEISCCGTKKISFSGGEPLLREDIGEIVSYCKYLGISPEINTTGYFLEKKIHKLKDLDLLKISIDGPEGINELSRGNKDTFKWAIDAASCAKANGMQFIFTTTLNKFNINCIEEMVRLAKNFGTSIAFQPIKKIEYDRGISTEEVNALAPDSKDFKECISRLVDIKKKDRFSMRNSLPGLGHIYNWPYYKKLKCWGGKIFCMIASNGEVSPCDRIKYSVILPNCAKLGFRKAFNSLPDMPICDGCGFCGTFELNYLMSLKLNHLDWIMKFMF